MIWAGPEARTGADTSRNVRSDDQIDTAPLGTVHCPVCNAEQPIVAMGASAVTLACGAGVYVDDGVTWVSLEKHRRFDVIATAEEHALIGHVRGWCHDSTQCALCQAQNRALMSERELDRVISG